MSVSNSRAVDPAIVVARPMVEAEEGCVLTPYQDVGGTWTIGWGFTRLPNGEAVTASTPAMTQAEADAWLTVLLEQTLASVDRLVAVPLNPYQTAALIDFTYNLGEWNLARSTLLRMLNQGDYMQAAAQFPRWDYVDGQPNDALLGRRKREEQLFLTPWGQ